MARSEKSENKNRVLGLDIGNGYGYVSLLESPKNDPIPLLPASLSTQGMPTTAYVLPPDGEQIDVFSEGRAAEQTPEIHSSWCMRQKPACRNSHLRFRELRDRYRQGTFMRQQHMICLCWQKRSLQIKVFHQFIM